MADAKSKPLLRLLCSVPSRIILATVTLLAGAILVRGYGEFWSNAAANGLGSYFAIAFGVPVAMAITAWGARLAEEASRLERERQETEAELRIVGLLLEDVRGDPTVFVKWRESIKGRSCLVGYLGGRWDVFKTSGELRSVRDPVLLAKLADYYVPCGELNAAAKRLLTVWTYVGMDVAGPGSKSTKEIAKDTLFGVMQAQLDMLEQKNPELVAALDARIGKLA